jgi:glucosyl-3-phosphoglycerate synthase
MGVRSLRPHRSTRVDQVTTEVSPRITVCLPALNEQETVGRICTTIRQHLIEDEAIVHELLVIDSGSDDDTPGAAENAGATVHRASDLVPEFGPSVGKGDTLWRSLTVATGDIIVWLDSDTLNFAPHFVTALVEPLLCDPSVTMAKAFYERPLRGESTSSPLYGARVTELVARPLLNMFFPELANIVQPLSGEYAGRITALKQLPFFAGYGVEVGLLIDLARTFGRDALTQVNLGRREHRNRATIELGTTAFEVIHAVLTRADDMGRIKLGDTLPESLLQFLPTGTGRVKPRESQAVVSQRPPIQELV